MSIFTPPHLLNGPRWNGMRVGLLGGSFNPPHEGHVHISLAAMKGLRLDAVWWLVTPQNPIKELQPLPLEERMRLSEELVRHPRILISALEKDMGTAITYDSIRTLKKYFFGTDFVWISGMDNALSLHRWNHWQGLLKEICMVHLTRNPARSLVRSCPLRLYNNKQKHAVIDKSARFPIQPGITYWMMQKKMIDVSSTDLRKSAKGNIMGV